MIFRNQGSLIKKSNSISKDELIDLYGLNSYEFTQTTKEEIFVCSKNKDLDLIELDQLLHTVGWSRRPIRRVKRALDFSILVVGLWRHDDKFRRLVGFARCTGDGILEATVWDVAINPVYQGLGLGKELMKYILKELKNIGISKVTLFADAEDPGFWSKLRFGKLKVIVLALPEFHAQNWSTLQARRYGFTGKVIIPTRSKDNINILKQSGADEIYDAYEAAGIGVSNIIKRI